MNTNFAYLSSQELLDRKTDLLNTIFPEKWAKQSNKSEIISTLFIVASTGNHTLLLGNGYNFGKLRNSCDPLHEVCPVVFDCAPAQSSARLKAEITVNRHGIQTSEAITAVALEIGLSAEGSLSSSETDSDPETQLINAISTSEEVLIGKYRVRKIENTWNPPKEHSDWDGLAFKQSDGVIYTWLHEANPKALKSAKNQVKKENRQIEKNIKKKKERIEKIGKKIEENSKAIDGHVEETDKRIESSKNIIKNMKLDIRRIEQEIVSEELKLKENENKLSFIDEEYVNSSVGATLQCKISAQISEKEKILLIERSVCEKLNGIIDKSFMNMKFENLDINDELHNFILQKLNVLKEKCDRLIGQNVIGDWRFFKQNIINKKEHEMRESFEDFCRKHPLQDEEKLKADWRDSLIKKLSWLRKKLIEADRDLEIIKCEEFTVLDIRMFERHAKNMAKDLRRAMSTSYRLGVELEKYSEQLNLVRRCLSDQLPVHLVKRITGTGHIRFAIAKNGDSDPDSNLNEVHIPL